MESFLDLPEQEQAARIQERLKVYSSKVRTHTHVQYTHMYTRTQTRIRIVVPLRPRLLPRSVYPCLRGPLTLGVQEVDGGGGGGEGGDGVPEGEQFLR